MVRPTLYCVLLILACALLSGATGKEAAPRFNAKTLEGEVFNNASIKGKVVLLDFWTTWCGYCVEEASIVDKLNKEFSGKGLIVLAVNVGESKKVVKKYLEQHPRTSKVIITDDTNLAAMYAATVYPIYVVIDREGNVIGNQRGAGGEEPLREMLASAGLQSKEEETASQ